MTEMIVDSGVCGFVTRIRAASEDQQTVAITYETTCPHAAKARGELTSIDAYAELFRKLHDTVVYSALSKHLPHVTCPLYSGFLKAIEAAAGLALPKGVSVRFIPS
jgi:hypothetical protein